jgi:selenocysteine lyase/cysteine desulfurase
MVAQVARWRADTPGCAHRTHLNNAGAGLMPSVVVDAMDEHLRLEAEIGGYEASDARAPAVAETYGALAELAGVPYSIDACQAVGQLPIDVERLRCDYLSVTARKFLRGPRGIGFLYASDRALARGDHPLFIDMRGATWVAPDRYEIEETARRYEHWEFSYALVLGLGAAARYALTVGVDVAQARAFELGARLRDLLRAIRGVQVLDRGAELSAIVTAQIDGRHAPEVVQHLRTRGINTAATLQWYGLLDLAERGVTSAVRISPHYYNTDDELDSVAAAIGEMVSG